MPKYHFKVSTRQGKVINKSYDAESKDRAIAMIKQEDLIPINEYNKSGEYSLGKIFRGFDLLDFSENLLTLLQSGIQLEEVLVIFQDTETSEDTKSILQRLHQGLHEGESFASLLSKFPNYFPEAYCTMIKTGEESGKLVEVLQNYNDFLSNRKKIRSFIISSSLYPLFIILMSIGIVVFFLFYMMPKLKSIFEQARDKSFFTNLLLQISNLVDNYLGVIILLVLCSFVGIYFLFRNQKFVKHLNELSLKVPIVGSLIILKNIIFFVSSLEVLLKSSIPLIKAVKLSRITITNPVIKNSLINVETHLEQGKKLSIALEKSPYIPSFFLKMLSVGEETGNIPHTLQRISEKYQQQMEEKTRRLLSLLEPIVIVLVGLFIGIIVISIFSAISDATSINI